MHSPSWMKRKQRVCHITLRDIDIPDFDVQRLMSDLNDLSISVCTLFAGGYVATYPSRLDWQRQCPGLEGRDLFGELLAAGRRAGIVVVPCIDIGEVPMGLARSRPELAAIDADGRIMEKSAVTAKSCALGPYIREHSRQIVEELVERYEIEAIKWAGASYGGTPPGCCCEHCRARYLEDCGEALPADTRDSRYTAWLESIHIETVAYLRGVAESHGLAVIGNSVWHLGRTARDLAATAGDDHITQVEIQTRYHSVAGEEDACWERFTSPTETTRYVSAVSKNPPWVVASYFLAWPWRWAAVPGVEQTVYLAQVAANGGSPMINFTTGAPHQHYDQRGMPALRALFGLVAANDAVYQNDRSAAEAVIIYDHDSSLWAQRIGKGHERYMSELYGIENILDRNHIPYDILSSERLDLIDSERHRVCLVPGATALAPAKAERLLALHRRGIGLIFTGAPGSRSIDDEAVEEQAWWGEMGIGGFQEPREFLKHDEPCPPQAYAALVQPDHALLAGVDAPFLAMADQYYPCATSPDAAVPLRRLPTFRLFPEGRSYPDCDQPQEPLAVVHNGIVAFPMLLGKIADRVAHPDHARLLVNAVALASDGRVEPMVDGRPDLRLSRRRMADGRLAVHVINCCGRDRFVTEVTPLYGVELRTPQDTHHVLRINDGRRFDVSRRHGYARATIDRIEDYEVYVMEAGEE
jgi:putative glycosyl hydrolase-like family 6 (GHL6) protein